MITKWVIEAKEWSVFLGEWFIMGIGEENTLNFENSPEFLEILESFERLIKATAFSPGIHWIRLYYSQQDHKSNPLELLLDNDNWTAGIDELSKIEWPKRDNFFSMRKLLILKPYNLKDFLIFEEVYRGPVDVQLAKIVHAEFEDKRKNYRKPDRITETPSFWIIVMVLLAVVYAIIKVLLAQR